MKLHNILVAFLVLSALSSCKEPSEEDAVRPGLTVGSTYDARNYDTNTEEETTLGDNYEALTDEMDLGTTATLNATTLKNLFEAGTPSLSSITPSNLNTEITKTGGWFELMATASGNSWTPAAPTGGSTGGVYDGGTKKYLFDANGVQYNEVIEKVLNNASFYNHMVELASAPNCNLATVDKMLEIYGAKPTFANSSTVALHPEDYDRFTANYVGRRDKNNGQGFYSKIKYNFLMLQAAIKAGPAYNVEKNAAIAGIKSNWEKAMFASVVNYASGSLSTLSKTTLTDDDKTSALHSISEAIGFMVAWYGVPQEHRKITDAQLATCLSYLEYSLTSTPTTYKFATDITPIQLAKLTSLNDEIKEIYGFSTTQMNDFKFNWVKEQNR